MKKKNIKGEKQRGVRSMNEKNKIEKEIEDAF